MVLILILKVLRKPRQRDILGATSLIKTVKSIALRLFAQGFAKRSFLIHIEKSRIKKTEWIRVARWFVFKPKNQNLGKFCSVLLWKILVYFMTIWSMLWPLEIFFDHLVYFVLIWNTFPRFVILYQEKSGNPGMDLHFYLKTTF
jgi:hypothetical protein